MARDFKVSIPKSEIRDFACWDDRVNEKGWEFALLGGTHRDVGTVDQSNAEVIAKMLEEIDPDQDHWGHLEASHWAVGWYRHLIIDTGHEPIMKVLRDCMAALDSYPILDERHWCDLELGLHDAGRCDENCSHCEYEEQEKGRENG